MDNPAQNILDAMDEWQARADSVTSDAKPVSIGGARQMQKPEGVHRALMLTRDLDAIRLELHRPRLEPYQAYLTIWTQVVLAYPYGWKEVFHSTELMPAEAYLALKLLAHHWEEAFDAKRDLPSGGFRPKEVFAIDDLLAEVDRLVKADLHLPEWVREFVVERAQAVRDELAMMDRGEDHSVPEAVTALINAMLTASQLSQTEGAGWKRAAEKCVRDIFVEGAGGFVKDAMVLGGKFVMRLAVEGGPALP